jgi:hypothetical protein
MKQRNSIVGMTAAAASVQNWLCRLGLVCAAAGCSLTAQAQEAITVQSLLDQDFAVVGAITSPIGPGVLLQKRTACLCALFPRRPNRPL